MQCNYGKEYIQAYLDGELLREERKDIALHLENCPECQSELQSMKRLDEWVKIALEESLALPIAQDGGPDVQNAWERFQNRLEIKNRETENLTPDLTEKRNIMDWKGRWENMKNNQKKWIAGGVAAAVFAGSLFVPQVRAVASDMLSMLRIDKIQTVKLTPQDLEQISGSLSGLKNGEIDMKDLGHMSIDGRHESQSFATIADAAKAGVKFPELTGFQPTLLGQESAFTATMELNVDKLEALSKQLGSEVDLDSKLNNQPFSIVFSPSTYAGYQSTTDSNVQLSYGSTLSPQINVPEGVDMNQVRAAMLSAPFLPEDVRGQLAGIQDWQSTLPIPYVEGKDHMENVKINGASGVFVAQDGGQTAVLVWQDNGSMHMLSAKVSDGERKDVKGFKSLLLDAAEQF